MENRKIIKCFIASPGDTSNEREICEKVFSEINRGIGVAYNFEIQSLRWENDVHPGIGKDGQDVINRQIDGKYDLFIGIMYTRFGTPTTQAESGTEEEFSNAYKRAVELKNMEIMFYFNDEKINPSKISIEQYQKVQNFRDNVVAQKCMYSLYDGINDFEEKLKKHLNTYFHEHYASSDKKASEHFSRVSFVLEERLNSALKLFSGQPKIWIDPIISTKNEITINPDENEENRINPDDIIEKPHSMIISAPPLFGLTCLSHYLVLEAWRKGQYWLYIDAKKLKAHNIDQYIYGDYAELNVDKRDLPVSCVIIDEWNPSENGSMKKLKSVSERFPTLPIIVMRTIEGVKFLKEKQEEVKIDREFQMCFLLPMTRNQVRRIVSEYNQTIKIADDDVLLEKVVSDLTTLNIHRTPQNCLTLLKVDEKKFDNNPVNRCQMLEDVLYVLFEFSDVPRYDSVPDVKDCQFILGCFCEMLIRENRFVFTQDEFFKRSIDISKGNLIDIDIKCMFDILMKNNILTENYGTISFKSTFWLLYFAARRMNSSSDFANYIFKSKKYLDYPEIIEFYTGIDRNRTDALNVLMKDIQETCEIVFSRISIPDAFNPYRLAKWNPQPLQIEQMQKEVGDSVINSGLPVAIKDKYQDHSYNQLIPFNQNVNIHEFFEEYYVYNLMQEIKSSSRALRNSDYADAQTKKELLQIVLRGWLQVSKVLFALIPVLASKGRATYGGAGFLLSDNFGDSEQERAKNILFVISTNVVGFFKDDIYSSKIAPLLYDSFTHTSNPLVKQQLALLLILCRPNKWYKPIEDYIVSLSKDSFFLFEVLNEMRAQYKFGFLDETDIRALSNLIRKCLAKHNFGVNNPSLGQIRKIPTSCLPTRTENDDMHPESMS